MREHAEYLVPDCGVTLGEALELLGPHEVLTRRAMGQVVGKVR